MTARLARLLIAISLVAAPAASHASPAKNPQQHFASPQEAVTALIAAIKVGETKPMLAILGPAAKPLIESGDPVADAEARDRVVHSYDEANKIDETGDSQAILTVGKDAWPFPIPLVKEGEGWRFDTAAGAQEVLARRIGRNELSAIQACLAFVDAQNEYYERDPEKSSLLHYARRFVSAPGKRDGLYYPTPEGEPESPLGELFAQAKAEGYEKGKSGKPIPFHGYYFKMLDGQGPHAKGGAYDYLVRGNLLGGFALVAYPATWGVSSVMTFQVNQDGVVYEKDLGPKTASIVARMARFDPDDTWKAVPDADEATPPTTEAAATDASQGSSEPGK